MLTPPRPAVLDSDAHRPALTPLSLTLHSSQLVRAFPRSKRNVHSAVTALRSTASVFGAVYTTVFSRYEVYYEEGKSGNLTGHSDPKAHPPGLSGILHRDK
ncbi:hypothetical protein AAFF_G00008450 [Aldrovandia affinis]|uniref:Uncharacterized protein n=1 Tax=Aldrovandia affinis TaxID=143900 RepID=A0AAD7T798_9TELE|nr:hypothetical protein AAFF_G00008450 [Aldrovandia affinis]